MDFHYTPLQLVFDGWIIVVLTVWAVVAVVRLRGRRRVWVVAGLVLWMLGTVLWMPEPVSVLMQALAPSLGPEVVWQLPTLPWVFGAILVAGGVLLPVRPLGAGPPPAAPRLSPPGSNP